MKPDASDCDCLFFRTTWQQGLLFPLSLHLQDFVSFSVPSMSCQALSNSQFPSPVGQEPLQLKAQLVMSSPVSSTIPVPEQVLPWAAPLGSRAMINAKVRAIITKGFFM